MTLVGVLPVLVLSVLPAVAPLAPLHVVHRFVAVGRYAAGDRGVDLAGLPGQTVVSATAGTVRFAGPVAGVGVVSVDLGGGRRLTYEPVVPSVRAGARLAAGDPLGRLAAGRVDCPAPACLHWGLVSGTGSALAYADPLALLGRARVRLLPLTGPPQPPGPRSLSQPVRRVTTQYAPTRRTSTGTTVADPSPSVGSVGNSVPTSRPPSATDAAALVGSGLGSLALGAAYAGRRGRASRRPRGP